MSTTITAPTPDQLNGLVTPYLNAQPEGLAFAIGYATGTNAFEPGVYTNGSVFDQYNHNLELGVNTYFELGSLSKTFTATLCAFLGEKYNRTWETQTISEYNINVGSQFDPIPLKALANYTSGLPADNVSGKIVTLPKYLPWPYYPAAMLGYLNGVGTATWKPTDIGKAYTYSNLAFSILAQLIPQFHGSTASEDLAELVASWVFGPLLMQNSYYFGDILLDTLPVGYTYSSPSSFSPAAPGHNVFPAYYGGGGVVSTPSDVLTWLQFNMGMLKNNPLYPILEKTETPSTKVTTPNGGQMGLGWFLDNWTTPQITVLNKDGSLAGYNSFMLFVDWVGTAVPSQAGVFVLTNSDGLTNGSESAVQYIAQSVLKIMLGV
ncbi:MAG: beta-lactamase family protein [Verrucomicrobia bacterium]|nr:beta-lactamase family protein [Verrucomicrobiota bacterium]